jgi:hypothetical protein
MPGVLSPEAVSLVTNNIRQDALSFLDQFPLSERNSLPKPKTLNFRAHTRDHTPSKRLFARLTQSMQQGNGTEEAQRVADAIRATFENNAQFHFRAPFEGLFCAEWANAFFNAANHELKNGNSAYFSVEKGWAAIPNDPKERIHAWIVITRKSDGRKVYVDDAFSPGYLFVHDSAPVFGPYVEVTNRPLAQLDFHIYPSFNHNGERIYDEGTEQWQ